MQSDRRLARACPPAVQDESWRKQALCAQTDPEAFFPDKGGSPAAAQAICRRCPVQGPCLEWALQHDERFGVWGGLTDRQRRRLAKQRRAQAAGDGTAGGASAC
jgi:WhiB family redox-sensing transcriptional regulator